MAPPSFSFFRNLFKSRNSFETTSSFKTPSQLSCRVSISSLRRSFCSSESLATHTSLSNTTDGTAVEEAGWRTSADTVSPVADTVGFGLGGAKKEVIDALALGFFAASAARSTALRFRDMVLGVLVVVGWNNQFSLLHWSWKWIDA